MGRGRLYSEYWADCGGCDANDPMAETNVTLARKEAKRLGWGWIDRVMYCPRCIAARTLQGPKQHGWPVGTRLCDCVPFESDRQPCRCDRAVTNGERQ